MADSLYWVLLRAKHYSKYYTYTNSFNFYKNRKNEILLAPLYKAGPINIGGAEFALIAQSLPLKHPSWRPEVLGGKKDQQLCE